MGVTVSHMRTYIEGSEHITEGAKQAFSEIADGVLKKHGDEVDERTCAEARILYELLLYSHVICLVRDVAEDVPPILRDIDAIKTTIKTSMRGDLEKISGSLKRRFEAIDKLKIPEREKPLLKINQLSRIYKHPGNVQKYVPESKEAALDAIGKLAIKEESKNILKERVENYGHADPLLSQFIFFNDGYQKMLDCITSLWQALKKEADGTLANTSGLSEEYAEHLHGIFDNYYTWIATEYSQFQREVGRVFDCIDYDGKVAKNNNP